MDVVVPILAGLVGILAGAFLSRRNARSDHADRLLAEAVNDLVAAVASVAAGDANALPLFAAAKSRIVLHGSPELVAALQMFAVDPTTATVDGCHRLVAVVQAARRQLGRAAVDEPAAKVILFGSAGPK